MRSIKLEYLQDHLAELVEEAGRGESFLIERAGRPSVRLSLGESPSSTPIRRTGFLRGQIRVPEDFDTMGGEEIAELFEHGR